VFAMSAFDIGVGAVGHEVLTFAWLFCALVLLKIQGVHILSCRELFSELFCERLFCRIKTLPRLPACPCLWCIFIISSLLSLIWGVGSGVVIIGPPSSWLGAFEAFPVVLFMVAFFEESVFRGLLVRRPTARGRGLMRGASWCTPEGVSLGSIGGPLIEDSMQRETSLQEQMQREVSLMIQPSIPQPEDSRRICAPVPPRPPLTEMLANAAIFVVYHLGVFHPERIFQDWRFLVDVALCAFCCFELLVRTQSIWPSVLAHGLFTWFWLSFGGGDCDLNTPGCNT